MNSLRSLIAFDDTCGERGDDRRVVVHRRRAVERQPVGLRPLTRLDVEVVEHLEVIGHEPARAHEQPIGVLRRRELVDHAQDVGTEPRFWSASG